MKFRKKPVVIEAMQFTDNESANEILKWAGTPPILAVIDPATGIAQELEVQTLEDVSDNRAKHVASPGDWVIRGVQGEFYPCKPDIFAATYEAVDGAA